MSGAPSGDYDENQTVVPDSFIALYTDTRGCLTAPRATIAARHELCDDMANLLTEHCSTVHFRDGVDEEEVLRRVHQGLLAPPTTVEPGEAEWVVRRTAELLGWPVGLMAGGGPDGPEADDRPDDHSGENGAANPT